MSRSLLKSRSDNPNAPEISHLLYSAEKTNFAGSVAGAIFYGVVVVLFFQSMAALLRPTYHTRKTTRWGLVAYAVTMFSLVTVYTAMNLDIQSISYIDYRDFPEGVEGVFIPGPFGYQYLVYSDAISVVPSLAFQLNNWLADGLLLYRCYIIYAKKYWVIAFPCLMYLASLVMGLMLTYYQTSQAHSSNWNNITIIFGMPYYSISLSLNVILTLMIIGRLIMHSRNIRNVVGTPTKTTGLYNALVTMFVESSALYATSFLLFIGPWGAGSTIANIFFPILAEAQTIASLLIVLRVANRSALTSDIIVSAKPDSLHFKSQEKSVGSDGTLVDISPMSAMDTSGGTFNDLDIGAGDDFGHHGYGA